MEQRSEHAASSRMTWTASIITMVFLAAFLVACRFTADTPSEQAHDARVAAAWQQKQLEKADKEPPGKREHDLRVPACDSSLPLALQQWDHSAFRAINEGWSNEIFDRLMPGITQLGDGGVQAALLLLLWAYAARKRLVRWRRTLVLALSGVVVGLAAPLMKLALPRLRPPSLYPYNIELLVHPIYGGSFPSGHTLTSFAIATIIALRHRWAAAPAFAVAALVGLSRIAVGVHWPLDVLAGAVLGTVLGWAVTRWAPCVETLAVHHMPSGRSVGQEYSA